MYRTTFLLTLLLISPAMAVDYPDTRRDDTVDTFHGVEVEDPFRWLEDWSSEEVKTWSAAQNAAARKILDALPGRAHEVAELAHGLGLDRRRRALPRRGQLEADDAGRRGGRTADG